jgi:hypothetical protein
MQVSKVGSPFALDRRFRKWESDATAHTVLHTRARLICVSDMIRLLLCSGSKYSEGKYQAY